MVFFSEYKLDAFAPHMLPFFADFQLSRRGFASLVHPNQNA